MVRSKNSFAIIIVTASWVSQTLPIMLSESFSFPLPQQHPPPTTSSTMRPFSCRSQTRSRLMAMKDDFSFDELFSQDEEATSSPGKTRSKKQRQRSSSSPPQLQQQRHPSDKKNNDDTAEDPFLGYAIDSFLRGDYDRPFADDAAAPNPLWGPGKTVEVALRSLRALDEPAPSHGAAVFLRFSLPLSRGERWGDTSTSMANRNPWKEILRGSLTPNMFARRLRASAFAELMDWTRLDVTEGTYSETEDLVGVPNIAFVNAALYFSEEGVEPSLVQFTLRKRAGVWLIDTARLSQKELFVAEADNSSSE